MEICKYTLHVSIARDCQTSDFSGRPLIQKSSEARKTSAPKPTDIGTASEQTKEKPPNEQSFIQKSLDGVHTPYYKGV